MDSSKWTQNKCEWANGVWHFSPKFVVFLAIPDPLEWCLGYLGRGRPEEKTGLSWAWVRRSALSFFRENNGGRKLRYITRVYLICEKFGSKYLLFLNSLKCSFFKSWENERVLLNNNWLNWFVFCVHFFLRIFKINRLQKCTLINESINRQSYFIKVDQKCTFFDMKQYYRINIS